MTVQGTAISALLTGVSQLRTWGMQMSLDAAGQEVPQSFAKPWLAEPPVDARRLHAQGSGVRLLELL